MFLNQKLLYIPVLKTLSDRFTSIAFNYFIRTLCQTSTCLELLNESVIYDNFNSCKLCLCFYMRK